MKKCQKIEGLFSGFVGKLAGFLQQSSLGTRKTMDTLPGS